MKKRTLGLIGSTIMVTSLIFSPYTIDFSKSSLITTKEAKAQLPYQRDLLFVSDKNLDETVTKFKKGKKEKVVKATKIHIEKKIKNKSLDEYEDIAYHINDVKDDPDLQKSLVKAFKKGAKVYIYGGITFEEYKTILKIDKVSVKKNDSILSFGATDKELEQEKGKLKDNPESLSTEGEDTYDIIGYTLKDGEANQVMVSTINAVDENNLETATTENEIIQEVLESTYETVNVEEQKYVANQPTLLSFLKLNKANAELKSVKSNPARLYGNAYYAGNKIGYTATDWYLSRALPDGDSSFDYFYLEDKTTPYSMGGWKASQLQTDHDIPYDSDFIKDWDPGDDSTSPYSISFSAPFSVSWGFSMSGDPDVDDRGNQDLDFGRWMVTDQSYGLDGMSGEKFEPATTWKSSGTRAVLDIREYGFFTRSGIKIKSSMYVRVDYDY